MSNEVRGLFSKFLAERNQERWEWFWMVRRVRRNWYCLGIAVGFALGVPCGMIIA